MRIRTVISDKQELLSHFQTADFQGKINGRKNFKNLQQQF